MNDKDLENLIFLWKAYGCEKDEKLSEGAKQLKQAVNSFIRSLPKFETTQFIDKVKIL